MGRSISGYLLGFLLLGSAPSWAGPARDPVALQKDNFEARIAANVPATYAKLTTEIAEDLLEDGELVELVPGNEQHLLRHGKKAGALDQAVTLHHNRDQPFLDAIAKDPQLRRTVDFWRMVEFEMGPDEAVMYDLRDPGVQYGRVRFSPGTPESKKNQLLRKARIHLTLEIRGLRKRYSESGKLDFDLKDKHERELDLQPTVLETLRAKAALFDAKTRKDQMLDFLGDSGRYMRGKVGKRDWNLAAFRYAGRHFDAMVKVFEAYGLPKDYVYIGAVESHFNPLTRSPAGAYGIWQLMPYTARVNHRLEVSSARDGVDERRDPRASVIAAAEYLALKREEYANLDLTAISYNQGNYIRFAIRHAGTNDPVELLHILEADRGRSQRNRVVPKRFDAGMKYLPRAIAMREGFEQWKVPPSPVQAVPEQAYHVPLGSTVQLGALARALGSKPEEILALNLALPGVKLPSYEFYKLSGEDGFESLLEPYIRDVIVPSGFVLRIPPSKKTAFIKNFGGLRTVVGAGEHIVRSGEVLGTIAAKYDTSIQALITENALKGTLIRVGQHLKVPVAVSSSEPVSRDSLADLTKQYDRFDRAHRALRAAQYETAVKELDALAASSGDGPLSQIAKDLQTEAIVDFGFWLNHGFGLPVPDYDRSLALWGRVSAESSRAAYLIALELERRGELKRALQAYNETIRVHQAGRFVGMARFRARLLDRQIASGSQTSLLEPSR